MKCLICLLALALLPGIILSDPPTSKVDRYRVYLGTYTGKKSKGIYQIELDLRDGKLTEPVLAVETKNPSFVAIHPNQKFLYAVSEGGGKYGGVSAFAIDAKTGALTLLNSQSSGGSGPCHVVVDPSGKNVLAANYGSGSCCCIPIQADGKLAEPTSVMQHKGSSANKSRQEGPHAHSINVDAQSHFAFCADLGLDKVLIYRFDPSKGQLTENDPPALELARGAGPRHFAFAPDGKSAYVNNELDSTVTACDYDAARGVLTKKQTLSTLPGDLQVKNNSTAEVVVHPSGKFVYVSNRGHNSIAIFAVDPQGKMTAVGHQTHKINIPRNFAIEPTGRYLLVANEAGHSVLSFQINAKTGELTPTGSLVEVPSPVCVRFLPITK